ncbi:MAG: DsrE family protein [Planctomycetes bacterium]|nr:DsrE family protein [Planctomycetota bacterium]
MKTVVLFNQDRWGHGDADLGARILKTFLQKVRALGELEALVFVNGGVKLVAQGSPVLGELELLHENGVELLPCGTCLTHYGLEPGVGAVSSMDEILTELAAAEKVVTL